MVQKKVTLKNNFYYWGKIVLIYLPFCILLFFLATKSGHEGDTFCWIEWSKYIFQNGLSNVYKSWTDYLPLYHYVLFLYGKIQGSDAAIEAEIYVLKLVTILFELGSTLVLFKLLQDKFNDFYKSVVFSLFYFLNFSILYNSLIWGQIDGIMSFFIFASVTSGYYKKLFACLLFFVLALNLKLQAIVFLPLIVLLILPILFKNSSLKSIIVSFAGVLGVQFLIILPFIFSGDINNLWKVVTGSVGKFPVVSMNAYNMWYFFIDGNLMEIQDSGTFANISYKNWGLLSFFVTSFFALYHFIRPTFQIVFKGWDSEVPLKKILISASLIPLLFFFFNTQMHERYTHPAFIFLAAYAFLYKRPLPYIIASVAYFLNLEDVLRYFQINHGTFVFSYTFISVLYMISILLLFADILNFKLIKTKTK